MSLLLTSVPGKMILLGEHAVVHGAVAVATSTSLHLHFEAVEKRGNDEAMLAIEPLGFVAPWSELRTTRLSVLSEIYDLQADALRDTGIRVSGQVPAGVGMGFSAALSLGLARSFAALGVDSRGEVAGANPVRVAAWLEDHFHGGASGVDLAAVQQDGVITFSRAAGAAPCSVGGPFVFAAAAFPVEHTTRELVARVREQSAQPEGKVAMDQLFGAAVSGRAAIEAGDVEALAASMRSAHEGLQHFQLYTETTQSVCDEWLSRGALAVKTSGAGGGGLIIALCPDHATAVALCELADSCGAMASFVKELGQA